MQDPAWPHVCNANCFHLLLLEMLLFNWATVPLSCTKWANFSFVNSSDLLKVKFESHMETVSENISSFIPLEFGGLCVIPADDHIFIFLNFLNFSLNSWKADNDVGGLKSTIQHYVTEVGLTKGKGCRQEGIKRALLGQSSEEQRL